MVKKRAYTSPKHRPDKPECAGSSPARGTIQRTGGREAQCESLQNSKTVSSNLTRCSKLCPCGQIGKGSSLKRSVIFLGSSPSRGTIIKVHKCLGQADVAEYSSGKSWVGRFNSCECTFIIVLSKRGRVRFIAAVLKTVVPEMGP